MQERHRCFQDMANDMVLGKRYCVHCVQGQVRSPAAVVEFLMYCCGLSFEQAEEEVSRDPDAALRQYREQHLADTAAQAGSKARGLQVDRRGASCLCTRGG